MYSVSYKANKLIFGKLRRRQDYMKQKHLAAYIIAELTCAHGVIL